MLFVVLTLYSNNEKLTAKQFHGYVWYPSVLQGKVQNYGYCWLRLCSCASQHAITGSVWKL